MATLGRELGENGEISTRCAPRLQRRTKSGMTWTCGWEPLEVSVPKERVRGRVHAGRHVHAFSSECTFPLRVHVPTAARLPTAPALPAPASEPGAERHAVAELAVESVDMGAGHGTFSPRSTPQLTRAAPALILRGQNEKHADPGRALIEPALTAKCACVGGGRDSESCRQTNMLVHTQRPTQPPRHVSITRSRLNGALVQRASSSLASSRDCPGHVPVHVPVCPGRVPVPTRVPGLYSSPGRVLTHPPLDLCATYRTHQEGKCTIIALAG